MVNVKVKVVKMVGPARRAGRILGDKIVKVMGIVKVLMRYFQATFFVKPKWPVLHFMNRELVEPGVESGH